MKALEEVKNKLERLHERFLPFLKREIEQSIRKNKLENQISKDPRSSYLYALNVLGKRFKKGEEAISKDAYYSYLYARDVLQKRFRKGEAAISKQAKISFLYARDVLKSRFLEGEETIAQSEIFPEYIELLRRLGVAEEATNNLIVKYLSELKPEAIRKLLKTNIPPVIKVFLKRRLDW